MPEEHGAALELKKIARYLKDFPFRILCVYSKSEIQLIQSVERQLRLQNYLKLIVLFELIIE